MPSQSIQVFERTTRGFELQSRRTTAEMYPSVTIAAMTAALITAVRAQLTRWIGPRSFFSGDREFP